MAALIREQDVDYNDIRSVLNYIVQQVNNGQDLVIDFTKKRSYRGSSYYHEDIKYKRALLDIATALVKRGEDYTEMYFKNAVRAHQSMPENEGGNYNDFLEEYIGRTAPKTTHYELTFMIGSKKQHFIIQISQHFLVTMEFILVITNRVHVRKKWMILVIWEKKP